MKTPLVRNRNHKLRVTVPIYETPPKAATQQQFKDECDINRIVKNAQRGIPPKFLNRASPQYGDFSQVPSITEAYNIIKDAEEAFMTLPAQLRLELGNDPANYTKISTEQLKRFKLLKEPPSPADPVPPSENAKPAAKSPKGGSKMSSNDDE